MSKECSGTEKVNTKEMREAQLISGTPRPVLLSVFSKQTVDKDHIISDFINHSKEFGHYFGCDGKPRQVLNKWKI